MQTKVCCRCNLSKLISLFNRSVKGRHGVHSICKTCKAVYMKEYAASGKLKISKDKYRASEHGKATIKTYTKSEANKIIQKAWAKTTSGCICRIVRLAKYRALKALAMPIWVDLIELKNVYTNAPENLDVDHIIPLQGNEVCGLHVPWNLQYLTRGQNATKSNSFDWTYNNEGWKRA